jgi:hypothetical protein
MFPNKRNDGRTGICSAVLVRQTENTAYVIIKGTDVEGELNTCKLVMMMQIVNFSIPSIFLPNKCAIRS